MQKKGFTHQNFLKKNLGGFTIIEVLAAIFVLTVGMIGVLTVIQQTMAQIETLNERLIAIYFAQEGIEIVRNIRDGNWLAETTWDNNLGVGNWEADYLAQDLSSWVEPGSYLRIDGGFYNYSSGTSTAGYQVLFGKWWFEFLFWADCRRQLFLFPKTLLLSAGGYHLGPNYQKVQY